MTTSPGIWITAVPPLDPAATSVLIAVDTTSADPGEQAVNALLGYGHEGEEGVFHLLPDDLSARYTRTPGRLAVTLVTHRAVLTRLLAEHPALSAEFAGRVDRGDGDDWVPLLRRELATDFVPAERDGEPQPVLLVDHPGPAATIASAAEPLAAFAAGEAGIAVLGAR
ncbi:MULTISPECIES: hypothetical protein [Kitasatospora]|uniref:Uncharacterized protein n=1 Tax=Kitasatospora setae (strain ATCC 33774 / DSM 43861 / JCM 3304 / KCC A-0304 / NBRC 14216 / KM-6054) TaxID=452652 RepID=E4N973_KITSK|nr:MULTISPECIES: hypothetical protein [Kitasatospora]BAJ27754.1 hypothetical protein KSE_19300 [Kitasatospora setae KM-6054]